MNNFLELAKTRYSVRNYLGKPVEDEKLNYILECGRVAPSAANYQPWLINVVRDPQLKKNWKKPITGTGLNRPLSSWSSSVITGRDGNAVMARIIQILT